MTKAETEKDLRRLFDIGLALKAIDGALELIGGIALWFISAATIAGWAHTLTLHELSEDPRDLIANHVLHSASALTPHGVTFASLYLISHGLAKLIIIVAVARQKLWAYPAMMMLLSLFVIYQLYRIGIHPTIGLPLLTAFDIAMIYLTWHEYQIKRAT